jgi:hypothetical protein
MSSTRQATDGGFHQERFCSAAEFEKGLLANLVAKRCEMLTDAKDRELIWFIQLLSHRDGLEAVAADLVNRFPDRIGDRDLATLAAPGVKGCTVEEVEAAMETQKRRALLSRQADIANRVVRLRAGDRNAMDTAARQNREQSTAQARSIELTHFTTDTLPKALAMICTDPRCDLGSFQPWYFRSLIESLRQYMASWIEARRAQLVSTALSRQVCDSLDYVLDAGGMIVLEGPALRVGKTWAAQTWCDLHPGRARFVQVPATNDDIGFFRAIAQSIGSASALSLKGVQLRERVELSLQSSRLMLVFDSAHYLWPQNNRREALPNRLNWLLAALVNQGVPCALLTTPQFARDQKIVEKKTGWTSAQFLSHISEYKELPEVLSEDELLAVAMHCLPTGDRNALRALALYAIASGRYLSAIEAAANRARFLAGKDGRGKVTFADVEKAIKDYVLPSDQALKEALAGAPKASPKGFMRPPARPAGQTSEAAPAPERSSSVCGVPRSAPESKFGPISRSTATLIPSDL